MEHYHRKPRRWLIERLGTPISIGLLVSQALAGLSGAFLTFDFIGEAKKYPKSADMFEFCDKHKVFAFVISSVVAIAAGISNMWIKSKIPMIRAELDLNKMRVSLVNEKFKSLVNILLLKVLTSIGRDDCAQDRISLFIHNGENHFTLCGRYSFNTHYSVNDRSQYPENQGCLGLAWRDGASHALLPSGNTKKYQQVCLDVLSIDDAALKEISMRARTYAGVRIDGADGPVAVVLYESMDYNPLRKTLLLDALGEFCDSSGDLISKFADLAPHQNVAEQRGF